MSKDLQSDANKPQVVADLAYTDLREWIEEARKLGEVREVKGLNWQEEIGMASEVILHDESAPAVLFEDVPGTLPGSRVLVNFFGGLRQRMTLGFPTHLNKLELSEAFRTNYMVDLKRIEPRYVNDGPIFENIITGDAIDVTLFPTPKWHEDDGGRYIGTGSFNVTRDPDEGWINCGTYRVMIHDEKRGLLYLAGQAWAHPPRQIRGAGRAHAGCHRGRLRSHVLPDVIERNSLWRQRI